MHVRAIRLAVITLVSVVWGLFMYLYGEIFDAAGLFLAGMILMPVSAVSGTVDRNLIFVMAFIIPLVKSILPICLITFINKEAKAREYMDKKEFIETQVFFIAGNILVMYGLFLWNLQNL